MPQKTSIVFENITSEDIVPLTAIMTRAFDEDARIHLGEGRKSGPEGYDDGGFLEKWALNSPTESHKILVNGELAGACILWIREDGYNYLGNIFLDVIYQNQGIGLKVWNMIEEKYTDTKKWSTDTPGFSKRNHRFYMQKCGFRLVEIQNQGNLEEESYLMEKVMN
ncbi:Acetyltransferase (GNAT) domain-containing protein [Fontibacillus panacisegetis]|uniref:Acetyltransferase (GNAT) domain-containing protein n=1 Tax=Fontibacillus panacisegetis TaxID=670482 RepID=A0A1G7QU29_9BACL|nr:GNAT family N-acetyltransferase [Fontibacillus panacisegetis]SDG02015.1 Acetyltransferase (GNAT) domain-containing protein [Fontibacillus panacisegetis]